MTRRSPAGRSSRLVKPTARALALVALVVGWLCVPVRVTAPAAPARADASVMGALTCFAIDVSGSNASATDGEPPSDPGPVFVRQQVVELYREILADLGEAANQQVGVVTFGTGIGTEIGPLAISDPAARSQLETALPRALQPSAAEAAWTDWVAGVSGCEQMFDRSGVTRGMAVVLTDGFPQGPAGGPARQLAAISPMAQKLRAEGVTIQPVLYGAGADQRGPARQAMTQLAALGRGQLVLAATPLDMLRSALSLASLATGLPLGGAEVSVNGGSSVPVEVSPGITTAVLVVLRSSDEVQVSVAAPDGTTLTSADAGVGSLGLLAALPRPAAGTYDVSARGQGSVYAAELLRYHAVTVPSPSPSVGAGPARSGQTLGSGLAWELTLALGLGVLVIAVLLVWRSTSRRRPKGTLVAWWGSQYRTLDPVDLNGPADLAELVPTGAGPTGWSVEWTRQSPIVISPDGLAVHLQADDTKTVDTAPAATFTWFPDGVDTSLSDDPPGRPASTVL